MSTAAIDETHDVTGVGRRQSGTYRYERSPVDVLHLVTYLSITLVVIALTLWVESSIIGFEEDLVRLFDILTPVVERVFVGVAQALMFGTALGLVVLAFTRRRLRLLAYVAIAAAAGGAVCALVELLVDRPTSQLVVNELAERAGLQSDDLTATWPVASIASILVVTAPFVAHAWRRAGWALVVLIVLSRILVSYHLPADVLYAVPLGATVGAGILVAFGRPDRRPTLTAVEQALRDSGLPVDEVRPASVDARGSTPYFCSLDDGTGLFVKVLGADQRAADLLFRAYRYLRFRNIGDFRPFSSLRRTVEHEALLSLMARDVGVRTPRLRGVVGVGQDSMLLAYDMIDGSSLDRMADEEITDQVMREVWGQVAVLRRFRIAHRDLRRANVFVDDRGSPWLIDFGFSEAAADDVLMRSDVAQMMASFVVVASPERVVRVAVESIGRDAVASALPRLQINALSGATQSALKARKGLLEQLQHEVQRQCDIEKLEFEPLQRFSRKTIVTAVVLAGVTYFLLPQFADLPEIADQIAGANWGWLPAVIAASAVTYVGATFSLGGAVPQPVQPLPLFATQVGSSFASKVAPAGLGGMALNVRFLEKQGVDRSVAVSSVGMNTLAGFVGHMSLILVFMVWAGRDAFESFRLPDPTALLLGVVGVVVVGAVAMTFSAVRRLVVDRIVPIVKKSVHGVEDVIRRPTKVLSLLGGSVTVTMSYLIALYLSLQAFGGGLPFATVGAVYLVGAAIATAAPTPGGLGAVEAALIAGLVAAGLDNTVAVPAVFLYRACTFWLPILPGWACFVWLQRSEHI